MKLWGLVCCLVLQTIAHGQTASTANAGHLEISPAKIEFGSQAVGSASAPSLVTLTNSGSSKLKITEIITSGIDFQQQNQCGDLAATATCTASITFKPAIAGPRLGTLTVLASDGSTHYIPLSGIGK